MQYSPTSTVPSTSFILNHAP